MQDSPKKNKLFELLFGLKKNPDDEEFQVILDTAKSESLKTLDLLKEKKITISKLVFDLEYLRQLDKFRLKLIEEINQRLADAEGTVMSNRRFRSKFAKAGGLTLGKKRAIEKGKNEAYAAWSAWQRDPSKQPYGDKRGSVKSFYLDMVNKYGMDYETIRKWREKWIKDQVFEVCA